MRYVFAATRVLLPIAGMIFGLMALGFGFAHAVAIFCIVSGVRDWWRL